MKKNNKIYFTLLIVSLLFSVTSCVKEVEFTGEETAPLPVLNCVVDADEDIVYADLTKSLFFLRYGKFAPVKDAELTFTWNGTKLPMQLEKEGVYSTIVPIYTISQGDGISIKATMPEFGTITAETLKIPAKPVIYNACYKWTDGEVHIKSFTLKFLNNDPSDTYYKISVYSKIYNGSTPVSEWNDGGYEYISCNDSRLLLTSSDFPTINEGKYLLFPARNFSGDTCTLTIEFEGIIHTDNLYYVEVASISESLYKYFSTLNNYYNTQNNPFTEPVQVFTNIRGGLGIFGTKNKKVQPIDNFW